MSRYIDADAFIDDLYEHEFSNWCDKDEVSTLVNDAPSIDIVRCRECKHFWKYSDLPTKCVFHLSLVNADDFCSYGKVSEKPTGSEKPNNSKERSSDA